MKPTVLLMIPLAAQYQALISEHYDLIYAPDKSACERAIAERSADIRVVLTNGTLGMTPEQVGALPNLKLICALGVGYENLPVELARGRGIALANGAGTNAICVADHTMALLLASVRMIVKMDGLTRAGRWRDANQMTPGFSGKKMGLLGLGLIGQQIAKRGAAFDLEIGYHNRRRVEGSPYRYFDDALALAGWADFLIVATPGGSSTHHIVDAAVLKALGPRGYLVNIARGSVVDTAALIDALRGEHIAGAGLDVYEAEPDVPQELMALSNVVLTPHVAGRSPESITATVERFIENANLHFAGKPMISAV
jgi:lactate dehydrogenase-like 2-hydroxyacid dehydrogenase